MFIYSNINDAFIPRCKVILQKVSIADRKLQQRKGTSFQANLMSIHAEMVRYRRDGRTDSFSALYIRLW